MTVFISHARADEAAAQSLEGLLERRGHFVERDDGEVALEPVTGSDIVVTLISQAFASADERLRLIQRALDAWSAGRLMLVRLDGTAPPIGMRDLPIVDASAEEARDTAWADVASFIQKSGTIAGVSPVRTRNPGAGAGVSRVLVTLALIAPGLFATAATVSIWLANRIGPRPGGMAELLAGINAFGRFYHLPAGVTPILFALAILLMLGMLGRLALGVARPRAPSAQGVAKGSGVFVSAAPGDLARVTSLLNGAHSAGPLAFPPAGTTDHAGAIAAAQTVLVMCSPAAYQNDQVKRDLYLAERSGKRVVPVFLDAAAPPEDFAYFFAGQTGLALHDISEAEQPRALAQVLVAPPSASVAAAPASQE